MNNNNFYDAPIQLSRMLPERVAYFKFYDFHGESGVGEEVQQTGPVELDGLNVRFRVQQIAPVGHAGGHEAQFGICNLSSQMMAKLANIYPVPKSEETKQSGYRRVQLVAGYKSSNPQINGKAVIFDGSILKTHVSSGPPDVWFEFNGFTFPGGKVQGTFTEEADIRDILKWASEKCGFAPPVIHAKKTLKLNQFRIDGSPSEIARQLADTAAGGGMRLLQKTSPDNAQKRQLILIDVDNKGNLQYGENFGRRWLISEHSGLIGVPEIHFGSANIVTVFNPHIIPTDIVELKSSLMPYWNGVYWVARLEHYGELRGRDFCTKMELFKIWK